LRIFLEDAKLLWLTEIAGYYVLDNMELLFENKDVFPRSASSEPPNISEREVLFLLLNFNEIEQLDDNDPVMVLYELSNSFSPYFTQTYLYELRKDRPEEFLRASLRQYERLQQVVDILRECSHKECPEKALDILVENLFERSDLLSHLNKLDSVFVEKMTGWPQGKPPVQSAIALLVVGELLPDWSPGMLNNIVGSISKNEGKISEFLVTLLVVYALDVLRRKLLEIVDDISTVSKFKSSVIPRLWAVRDPRYRDLLSAVLMLDKVLNEQLEFAQGRDRGRGA